MSILGYSSSYFLPEYWSSTPLYGEKIIPLIDYILSTDFVQTEKLASAFYTIENKYKNTGDLPIECIKEIIHESGYDYVLELLTDDDDSIKLLVYLLVLIHQLKGTQLGIEVVLNLLRRDKDPMVLSVVGEPHIENRIVYDFSNTDYIYYSKFELDESSFELVFPIRTNDFRAEQCIASAPNHGIYLGINMDKKLVLCLGSDHETWNIVEDKESNASLAPNTNYFIKLTYDGFEYDVKVSTDNERFTDYIVVTSPQTTDIHASRSYLGIDRNTYPYTKPFEGSINLAPFSIDIENVDITQWFNTVPVGDENTFIIKAELDLGVVNTNFFENFANFISKYVYPTLRAFDARLKLSSNLTFIPYVRQRVIYVAQDDVQDSIETYLRDHYKIDPELIKGSPNPVENKAIVETVGDLDSIEEFIQNLNNPGE